MESVLQMNMGKTSPSKLLGQPLELQSKQSSLTKLQKGGFSVASFGGGSLGSASSLGLAKFLSREYGAMIPKLNISSLPDYKVTEFIRILTEYHKKMNSKQQYIQAKKARAKVKELAQIELLRQMQQLDRKQTDELYELKARQTAYFIDFQQEWDEYLAEEEIEAENKLNVMFARHAEEVRHRKREVHDGYHSFVLSKEYCTCKAQEKIHLAVGEYINAEQCKLKCEELFKQEKEEHAASILVKVQHEIATVQKLQLA